MIVADSPWISLFPSANVMIACFSLTKARNPNDTTESPSTITLIYSAFLLPPSLMLTLPAKGLNTTIPIEYIEKISPT